MFYQRNFGNEAGLLWVYDRQGSTLKELHPRVICYEKDLYSVKPENKPPDTQVESKLLGAVDGLGCKGIRNFQNGKASREAEEELALFLAFQYCRVPTISRDIRTTYSKAIEELGRVMFCKR
jgi:hypothetical protein